MSKYTPGPWAWLVDDKCIWIGVRGSANYLHTFAEVDYDDVDHEEAEANALLIAAAPELLEALCLLVDRIESPDGNPIKKARAAIAKATKGIQS